jgi:hypothetical protein
MRKTLLITIIIPLLVIVSWSLVIAAKAVATPAYIGLYWISGSISCADPAVNKNGRRVCFFKELDSNRNILGGYADDLSGPTGLAGRDSQYMINALQDERLIITPGRYMVAIVTGSDGYGADPIEVAVTGKGYEIVSTNLVLALGAGINPPAQHPDTTRAFPPTINNITFGNRKYQPALVARGEEFIVSAKPKISARATSAFGVNTSSLAMVLNAGTATAQTFQIQSSNITQTLGPSGTPTDVSFTYDFAQESQTLPAGTQTLTFQAANAYGETAEVCSVTIVGGEARLIGIPITYPSPLHLATTYSVTFQYTLSADVQIELNVFDVGGKIVLRRLLAAKSEGGSAGINKVSWDLITDQGNKVGSGIYVFTLINKETGKMLGKGKFTALP